MKLLEDKLTLTAQRSLFALSLTAFLIFGAFEAVASELQPKKIRDFTALGILSPQKPELWAAGVERNAGRTEVHPFLERIRGGKRLHQKLPSQLQSREIQAFWSGRFENKSGVATLSQWVIEQGDAPQLHFIPAGSKAAFKLAQAPCIDVDQITFKEGMIVFQCAPEEGTQKSPSPVSVSLPPELKLEGTLSEPLRLPVRKIEHSTLGTAFLPNQAGEENRLELTEPGAKKARIIRPLSR